jgi:A/G-specific adenine glycosylase
VIPKFEAWLKKFPTVESLAKGKTSDVLRLWSGLGYNRRALYLQQAARELRSKNYELRKRRKNNDFWPKTPEELMKLPGVGKYTAGAVACFAFDKQIAVVDTNIRRVILTQFQISNDKSHILSEKEIQEIADQLLPKGRAYEWNQALMDYAAAMLQKEKIPIAKQSPFRTSNRYYRGKVVRVLLKHHTLTTTQLRKLVVDSSAPADARWFTILMIGLTNDGLIRKKNRVISLP